MDAMESMLAEHACQRLVHNYANWLDGYDYERFMSLWTDDAQWVVYGSETRGLSQIRAALAGRPRDMVIRHVTTNVVIDVTGPDRAQGQCYATAYRAMVCRETRPAPLTLPRALVDYRDWFERDPVRGWLFCRREIVKVMEPIEPTPAAA